METSECLGNVCRSPCGYRKRGWSHRCAMSDDARSRVIDGTADRLLDHRSSDSRTPLSSLSLRFLSAKSPVSFFPPRPCRPTGIRWQVRRLPDDVSQVASSSGPEVFVMVIDERKVTLGKARDISRGILMERYVPGVRYYTAVLSR